MYGADGDFKAVVNSLDDARSSIKRTKAFGAFSVKSYNQPRREQRQQIIQAAREENVIVVPEGGSTFYHNMTMIMDGHTGVEHNIPVAPVYKDVLTLWGNSNTGYTPTLVVNYAGMSGEYYWYQNTNVWENEKLLKYFPRGVIDSRSRHRVMVPQEEYENGHILTSETCKALTDVGFGTIEIRARKPYRILSPADYPTDELIYIESIEVAAIKDPMPEDGPCVFTGKAAIYFGSEEYFDDKKGHVLLPNQPIAVCDKTAGALADLKRDDIYISESTFHYDGGGCC